MQNLQDNVYIIFLLPFNGGKKLLMEQKESKSQRQFIVIGNGELDAMASNLLGFHDHV